MMKMRENQHSTSETVLVIWRRAEQLRDWRQRLEFTEIFCNDVDRGDRTCWRLLINEIGWILRIRMRMQVCVYMNMVIAVSYLDILEISNAESPEDCIKRPKSNCDRNSFRRVINFLRPIRSDCWWLRITFTLNGISCSKRTLSEEMEIGCVLRIE